MPVIFLVCGEGRDGTDASQARTKRKGQRKNGQKESESLLLTNFGDIFVSLFPLTGNLVLKFGS